jgi:hypothetical protein
MTREEIISMAREAGLTVGTNLSGVMLVGSPARVGLAHLSIDEMERFANLVAIKVAASEREWMQETNIKLIAEAVAAEREEILDLVDGYAKNNDDLIEAIRERGVK